MSVINQMLRDLDTRQKAGQTALPMDPAWRDVTRNTMSVASLAPAKDRWLAPGRAPMLLGLAIALALAGAWMVKERLGASIMPTGSSPDAVHTNAANPANPATPTTPTTPTTPAGPPVATPAPPLATTQPDRAVVTDRPTQAPRPLEVAVAGAAKSSVNAVLPPATPAPQAALPKAAEPVLASSLSKDAPRGPGRSTAATAVLAQAPPAAGIALPKQEAAPTQPNRTQVAMDVMAQAQSLWEQGARDAATQLLRDAIAVLERSASAGESNGLLLQAVRELTRMELVQGHAAAAMDLLQRLEPLLANQPDVWALRGNAAQRLGRHAESVQAYLTALKLRPGESRWMLGAAVSLAADGHTAQATELAEQARERGGLSAEVEAYLLQQGVALRRP